MEKAIVSVIGKDQPGIIAKVSNNLFGNGVNILDITQTILQDYFTMITLVDVTESKVGFEVLRESLESLGEELNLTIRIQHQDIFESMHRI